MCLILTQILTLAFYRGLSTLFKDQIRCLLCNPNLKDCNPVHNPVHDVYDLCMPNTRGYDPYDKVGLGSTHVTKSLHYILAIFVGHRGGTPILVMWYPNKTDLVTVNDVVDGTFGFLGQNCKLSIQKRGGGL